jgi:hypothetical protein
MKKAKWISIKMKDGTIEPVDYGWQMSEYCGNMILTRVKDGLQKEIKISDVLEIIHYTK